MECCYLLKALACSIATICSLQSTLFSGNVQQQVPFSKKVFSSLPEIPSLNLPQPDLLIKEQMEKLKADFDQLFAEKQDSQQRSSRTPISTSITCGYNTFNYQIDNSNQGATITLDGNTLMEPGGYGDVIDGTGLYIDGGKTICGQCYLTGAFFDGNPSSTTGSALFRVEYDGSLTPIMLPGGYGDVINGTGLYVSNLGFSTICGQCYLTYFAFDGTFNPSSPSNITGSALFRVEYDGSLTPIMFPGGTGDVINGTGLFIFPPFQTTICGQCYMIGTAFDGTFNFSNITGSALFRVEYDGSLTPIIFPGGYGDVINGTGLITGEIIICGQCYLIGTAFDGTFNPSSITGSALFRVEYDGSLTPIMFPGGTGDVINGTGLRIFGETTICGQCYLAGFSFDGNPSNPTGSTLFRVEYDGSLTPIIFPGGYGDVIDGTGLIIDAFLQTTLCGQCYMIGIAFDGTFNFSNFTYNHFTGLAFFRVEYDGSLTTQLLPNGQHAPSAELLDQLLCQASHGFPDFGSGLPSFLSLLITTLQSNNVSNDYLCRLIKAAGENPKNFGIDCPSASCFCNILTTMCKQGRLNVAAHLYSTATPANKTCLCDPQISVTCAAQILLLANIPDYEMLLPQCGCNESNRLADILTATILLATPEQEAIITRLMQEVATLTFDTTVAQYYQNCCSILPTVLTQLVMQSVSQEKLCMVLSAINTTTCDFNQTICQWFANMLRAPSLGEERSSTLLARFLSDPDTYCGQLGQQILNTLCCGCSDSYGEQSVDFTTLITDALVKTQTIFGASTLPTLTC